MNRGRLVWLVGAGILAGVSIFVLLQLFGPGDSDGVGDTSRGPTGDATSAPTSTASPPLDAGGSDGTSTAGTDPAGDATSAASPAQDAPRWVVVLSQQAGGLALTFSGGPELPVRENSMVNASIAVENLVGGRYESTGGDVVDFHGGTLAGPPLDARATIETTFRANFPNLTPDDESRQYDAGELGGEVWCESYSIGSSACGWVDEWTIGYVFIVGGDEPDTAALLVEMRPDLEVPE